MHHLLRIRLFAILGTLLGAFILVVATLTVNGTTLTSFQTLDRQARQQDKGVASTSAQPCANPRLQVYAPLRVLLTSQTESITTQVTNDDTVECDITLSLVAPRFKLQPTDNQRLIGLAPTHSSILTWSVTPTAVGLFTLAFTAGNASQQIGLSIVSVNGFNPFQAQTFNYLAIFFGFLLTLVSLVAWQRWENWRTQQRLHPSTPQRVETQNHQQNNLPSHLSAPAQPPLSTGATQERTTVG